MWAVEILRKTGSPASLRRPVSVLSRTMKTRAISIGTAGESAIGLGSLAHRAGFDGVERVLGGNVEDVVGHEGCRVDRTRQVDFRQGAPWRRATALSAEWRKRATSPSSSHT